MPDDDRMRIGLPSRWRQVQRSIEGGDSLDRTADLVSVALAADLRECGGIGRLESVAGRASAGVEPFGTEQIVNSDNMLQRHELALGLAAVLSDEMIFVSPSSAVNAFAGKIIANIMSDRFSRMAHVLVDVKKKMTARQVLDLLATLRRHEQVDKLRDRLIKDPQAVALRAPRRMTKLSVADDIMNTDLDQL